MNCDEEVKLDVLRYSEEDFEIRLLENGYFSFKSRPFPSDHDSTMLTYCLDPEIERTNIRLRALMKAKQFWG